MGVWLPLSSRERLELYAGGEAAGHFHKGPDSLQVTAGPGARFSLLIDQSWQADLRIFYGTLMGYEAGFSVGGQYLWRVDDYVPGLGLNFTLRFGEATFYATSLEFVYPIFPEASFNIVVSPLVFKFDNITLSALRLGLGTPLHQGFGQILLVDLELLSFVFRIGQWQD